MQRRHVRVRVDVLWRPLLDMRACPSGQCRQHFGRGLCQRAQHLGLNNGACTVELVVGMDTAEWLPASAARGGRVWCRPMSPGSGSVSSCSSGHVLRLRMSACLHLPGRAWPPSGLLCVQQEGARTQDRPAPLCRRCCLWRCMLGLGLCFGCMTVDWLHLLYC